MTLNADVYVSAFAGALAGMAASGRVPNDPSPANYAGVVGIAGAYATALDATWGADPPNSLDLQAIESLSASAWEDRAPQVSAGTTDPATYVPLARALVAQVLASETYFSDQSIPIPPAPGAGGTAATTTYDDTLVSPATDATTVQAALDEIKHLTGVFATNGVGAGLSAVALGEGCTALGAASCAIGHTCTASADYSHAQGDSTNAVGISSTSEGAFTTANTYGSHAEGFFTNCIGDVSHAEGNFTTAGTYGHAEGTSTIAQGLASHAEGNTTLASGFAAHAEGAQSAASRMCQSAHASTANNVAGDCQVSRMVFNVFYNGVAIELTNGNGDPLILEDGKGYAIVVTLVAKGIIAAANSALAIKQTLCYRRDAGTTVRAGAGTQEIVGDAAAIAAWSLTSGVGVGPDRVTLTFHGAAAKVYVVCRIEMTEIAFYP